MKALSIRQPWAWAIAHETPITCRGALGFFELPTDVEQKIYDQIGIPGP